MAKTAFGLEFRGGAAGIMPALLVKTIIIWKSASKMRNNRSGQMAKVMGLGGLFLKCADTDTTKAWYQRVLGMTPDEFGGFTFKQADAATAFGDAGMTIFAPFSAENDYFAPSQLPFMINFMVDDLDGMLEKITAEGVEQLQPAETHSYGRFAWILDPDCRKIELWQPFASSPPPTD
jgi:predicted enzyme related to lactoylglutathione lyase